MNKNEFVSTTLDFLRTRHYQFLKHFFVVSTLSSTNEKAKHLAQTSLQEGIVVIAQRQEHGRGRYKRSWFSPTGGLYLSVVLTPKQVLDKSTLLPLLGALVIRKSLEFYGLTAVIKWPNDVLLRGKKISGILLESESFKGNIPFVILGIGINLNFSVSCLPKDLQSTVTSVEQELGSSVDYLQFLDSILSNLDSYYDHFLKKNFDYILNEWKKYSDTLGRHVKMNTPSEEIVGTAVGIDDNGFLKIVTETQEIKTINTADCFYIDK
jgi:BirA family biotin operon repressor/biotin-[acetyl-CoA-carboxylase] ligase